MLYASRATAPLDDRVIGAILDVSRRNNPPRGITGILCFDRAQFVQALEGGRDEVCELYNTLVGDPRHERLRILSFEEIPVRRFGGWTMGQVEVDKVSPSLLLRHAERAVLDPFAVSGRAAIALLDDLIATGAVASRVG
jgi:hypothetical protein